MEKSINCKIITWYEAGRLARALAHKIIESGFKPDIVVGIARGGLVPARMICDFLIQNDLVTIRTEHWGIATNLGKARIKYSLPAEVDIFGKRILVVDDVADTGDSFSVIMDYLGEKKPIEIKTAVLQYKTSSSVIPDYWSEKLNEWNWVIYPWAFYEDLAGFIERLLHQPATNEEIRNGLAGTFNIKLPRKDLFEIMDDLCKLGKIRKIEKNNRIIWEKMNFERIE